MKPEADEDPFSMPPAAPRQVRLELPYPPSANRYWRTRVVFPSLVNCAAAYKAGGFNGLLEALKRDTFVNTYVSPEAKAFKEGLQWIAQAAGVRTPMSCRVRVEVFLYMNRPKDWQKRERDDPLYWADTVQRIDLDNTNKVVMDALRGIVIGDDKQLWELQGAVMEPDERGARLVVRVTPLLKAAPAPAQGALL